MIQTSLLPDKIKFHEWLANNFLIWKPKDIIGGDIVFTEFFDQKILIAVIDCTGHGVPGTFMTMIACSGLQRIINEQNCSNPGEILKQLNTDIKTLLQQDIKQSQADSGLEASICLVDVGQRTLTYSGARLPLYYVQDNKCQMIKGDKESIGYQRSNQHFLFTNHELKIEEKTCFYMCTDGFIQQLGGKKNISYGKKRLSQLLIDINKNSFEEQKDKIMIAYHEYRGTNDIQDDVTFVGFKP